jgi:hypothetical protein
MVTPSTASPASPEGDKKLSKEEKKLQKELAKKEEKRKKQEEKEKKEEAKRLEKLKKDDKKKNRLSLSTNLTPTLIKEEDKIEKSEEEIDTTYQEMLTEMGITSEEIIKTEMKKSKNSK